MGALVTLDSTAATVEPGQTVTWAATVRNTGSVVDEFTLTVVGDAAAWAVVEPGSLSLFPGAEGAAEIRFSPPRVPTQRAGPVPVGVKAASREDPAGSTVEESTLTVGSFQELTAELVPRTSRGRRSGRHEVAVDNRGNTPLRVRLRGTDADEQVALDVTPASMAPGPGKATFGRVHVVARKRFLRGAPQSRPFQLVAESDDAPPVTVDGAFMQEAMFPRWALAALIALLLALLLLWFALLRPAIQTAAKNAVGEELAVSAEPAGDEGPADGAGDGAAEEPAPEPAVTTLPPAPPESLVPVAPPTTITTLVPLKGNAIDGRLFLTRPGSASYTVPDGNRLQLTDIVLQNPNGNSGTVQLKRDGITLLVVNLDNFRDLDYHFVSPIAFNPGQRLVFTADCSSSDCSPGIYYSGVLEAVGG